MEAMSAAYHGFELVLPLHFCLLETYAVPHKMFQNIHNMEVLFLLLVPFTNKRNKEKK